jgi:aspartate/methionine/tyrosine aminotransferase
MNPDFSINFDDLRNKINDKTKLLVINTPCNPTGKILDQNELILLSEIISEYPDLYVISDEVYSTLYYTDIPPPSMASFSDKVIAVNGISKRSSCPGLRIGWTVAPHEITGEMLKIHQYGVTCAPSISQYAAIPVLNGECAEYEKNMRNELRQNRDLALEILGGIPVIKFGKPQGAFYLFIDVSDRGMDSKEMAQNMLKDIKVLTVPGIAFGEKGSDYLRLSFSTERDKLSSGLLKIKKYISALSYIFPAPSGGFRGRAGVLLSGIIHQKLINH